MPDLSIYNSMQDHEQALVDALARLTDLSDGESGTSRFSFLIEILTSFVMYCLVFLVALISFGTTTGIVWSSQPQNCCSGIPAYRVVDPPKIMTRMKYLKSFAKHTILIIGQVYFFNYKHKVAKMQKIVAGPAATVMIQWKPRNSIRFFFNKLFGFFVPKKD